MVRQRGSQSLLSLGIEWSSKITAIGLEFSIPALLGFGLDRWLRTTPAATVAGALVGFGIGMLQTTRILRDLPGGTGGRRDDSGDKPRPPLSSGSNHGPDRPPSDESKIDVN